MYCPFCNHIDTKVVDSRVNDGGTQVKRRRHCLMCESRFTTFEVAELNMPMVVKGDGRRKPFDEQKIRQGILKAIEKRLVSQESFEQCIADIKLEIRKEYEKEVPSEIIGEKVMKHLKELDHVAYVRFASVYRCFQDVSEFSQTVKDLNLELQ